MRLTVLAREGRGGVGGWVGEAMSLAEGRLKELNSCCGVEGAVEKGSVSVSGMVGAVDRVCFLGREDLRRVLRESR